MKKLLSIAITTTLLLLGACSGHWDCTSDNPNACKTITQADKQAYNMDLDNEDTFSVPISPAIVRLPKAHKTTSGPWRSHEAIARVYIFPFESKSGNLFEGGYVNMVLLSPRWVLKDPSVKDKIMQPLTVKKPIPLTTSKKK